MNTSRTPPTAGKAATRKTKPRSTAKRRGGLAVASAAMGEAARQVETPAPAPARGRAQPKKPKATTRQGKKGLVLYVHPDVSLALRKLALETDSDVQQLGRRALALLFAEYGRTLPDTAADRATGA